MAEDPFLMEGRWRDRAREELNEDPETARTKVMLLRSLVQTEKGLISREDDIFLLAMLRARKHNVDEAFKLMKNYYRLKKQYPKYLEDSLPSEKGFAYDMNGFSILAEKDQHDRALVAVRVEEVDLSKVNAEHFFQMMVTLLHLLVQDPLVQVAGVVILVDMTGFSLRKARIVTPTFARIAMRIMQDSFPLRLKGIHVMYEPFYFDAIYALFRPFIKEKLRRRIHLHGHNMSTLHAMVSRRVLPPILDGLAKDWNFRAFRRTMESHEGLFREWRKYGYKERKSKIVHRPWGASRCQPVTGSCSTKTRRS